MQGYTAIVVFDETAATILLCKSRKNPYKGMGHILMQVDLHRDELQC